MKIKQNNKLFYSIMITSLLLFLTTTTFSIYLELSYLDHLVADFLTMIPNPDFFEQFSLLGSVEFVSIASLLIVACFLYKKAWRTIFFYMGLSGGGLLLNYLLKIAFQRTRPGEGRMIEFFGHDFELTSYSFPSGHTMRAVILFSFIIHLIYQLKVTNWIQITVFILATAIMIGVAVSRILLEAHYFSDIIAAVSASVFWFCSCLWVSWRIGR